MWQLAELWILGACWFSSTRNAVIPVAAVYVCATAPTPGANGKQGLGGRCLCSKLLCFPSSRSSKGLFSLLRHSDDTANQRVSCFVSLMKRTQKISLPQRVLRNPSKSGYEAVTFIWIIKKTVGCEWSWVFQGLVSALVGVMLRNDNIWLVSILIMYIFLFYSDCILPEKLPKMFAKRLFSVVGSIRSGAQKLCLYQEV